MPDPSEEARLEQREEFESLSRGGLAKQAASADMAVDRSIDSVDPYAARHPQLGSLTDIPVLLSTALNTLAADSDLVIDVGCGEGQTLDGLKRRLGARSPLIGFDISHSRARSARTRGLRVIVADALRLPLPSGSVALAICRHMIEHVSDDRAVIAELSRVLRPGAMLYLETPLRLPGAWYPYRNPDGVWMLDPTHAREYRKVTEVEVLLQAAELTPLSMNIGPIRYRLAHLVHRAFRVVGLPGFSPETLDKRSPNLRIPRYREVGVLARSDAPVSSP